MKTKHHISFPSIEQFRNVIANINRQFNFVGLDVNGDAIYDPSLPKPILEFRGSVKLHGTNAATCFNNIDGLWVQSRENIITSEKDNAGCAFSVYSNKEVWISLIKSLADANTIDLDKNTISVYFEYAGGNIQKGVAITNLEKSAFIFADAKISPFDAEQVAYWIPTSVNGENLSSKENKIYNVNDYETFTIDIDFNMPQLSQNAIIDMTVAVENECPVGKAFGFSGVGEGVVFITYLNGVRYSFKSKGMKHSSSKVKVLASVDVDKLNSIKEFVEYAVTESRFNQGLEKTFGNSPVDVTKMGDLIRWVVADVMKEEMDAMVENKIEPKDVNKYISTKVREMFFKLPV